MSTITLRRYIVEGFGEFPIDMLRYDHSWPASEPDSARAQGEDGKRRVMLETYLDYAPTAERWASFLWPVVG